MSDLRIATRGSDLALAQARWVSSRLSESHPGLETSLVEVTTTGDRDRITSVTTLTEIGAFVRAVQRVVLEGEADIAVHSCKDLPVDGPPGLETFYPVREPPWDVLCGHDMGTLPVGALVGSGSPRRSAQLRRLRSDVVVESIRGNVGTRLEKMESGRFDAVVLAEAGLRRLGREREIGHRFSLTEMVPAPAQGALAVEIREDDPRRDLVSVIDDSATRTAVTAERQLLANTGAGCRSALGALGEIGEGGVRLTAFVDDERGSRRAQVNAATAGAAALALQSELGL